MWPVLVLSLCHAQAMASVHVVNILVDPIRSALAISDTQFSLLQGPALVVFAVLLGLPVARVADRRSRRNVIGLGVLTWSAGSLLSAVAQTFAQLLAARALVGIGEIILFPAALSIIYDLSPRHRLATAIGVFGSGGPIGIALAMAGGGWFVSRAGEPGDFSFGFGSMESWRAAFVICGIVGGLAALMLLTVAEPGRGAQNEAFHANAAPLLRQLRAHWRVYLSVSAGFIFLSTAVLAFNAWVPTYLVRVHALSYMAVGQLTGLAAALCAAAGAWTAGACTDRLARAGRRDAAVLAAVAAAILLALVVAAAVSASTALWLSVFVCATYFLLGMPTVLGGTALQQISPAHLRAQIMCIHVLLVNVLAFSIGPTSVAILTDHFFGAPASVGYSIATSVSLSAALALVALGSARRPFIWIRDQVDRGAVVPHRAGTRSAS